MLKKLLIMSSFILLGSLAASAQSSNRVSDAFDKAEPSTVEKAERDFQMGRDLQRENDRQRRDASESKTDIGSRSVTDRSSDKKDPKDKTDAKDRKP